AGRDYRGLRGWIVCRRQGPSERHRRVFRLWTRSAEERAADAGTQSLGPLQGLDVGPGIAKTLARISEAPTSDVAQVSGRALSACSGPWPRERHPGQAR